MNLPARKLTLLPVLFFCLLSGVSAQPLFTVDGRGVSKEEFLKAYNKNNNGEKPTEKSYRDYLELYIRYKLKVRAAYDALLDTLPGQRTELQNFRTQVSETYLKDEASLDKLVKEVFVRGQKDLRISHIFIALPKDPTVMDTLRAYEKAANAYNALKRGGKFGETAQAYSDDPSAKTNRGDIGYITVFTLPYELETLAYTTPVGQYSRPYRTRGGYHIFKVESERKAAGRIRVAQILVSYPPGANEAAQQATRERADSIYKLVIDGGDFATLAKTNSGDNLSYQLGGELPEFGVGSYDSAFEAAAFGLSRDGAVSKPVPSVYGFHIIKRISRKPFPQQFDEETAASLKQQVLNDPRVEVSRKALLAKIQGQVQYKKGDIPESDLWTFSDSALRNTGLNNWHNWNQFTIVFSFAQQTYTVRQWLDYFRTIKTTRGGAAVSDKDIFDRYVERSAMDYYRAHLEEYNKDFAFQLMEFKEGNLLFEIMQKKVWDKASTDSAGLRGYYEAHKDKYWWESSADALLLTCNTAKTAELMKERLQAHGSWNWRQDADSSGSAIQADSGRYEMAQIPGVTPAGLTPRSFTNFTTNKSDNTVSFAYILNVYKDRAPRNYHDARGFVINDYQTWLEDQWITELRKKYPVKVDQTVLASLPK